MYYNIAGLAGKRSIFDFFHYVKSFDVFCLSETFVEADKTDEFSKLFKEYNLCWEPAIRRSSYDRAMGGLVVEFKKGYSWCMRFDRHVEGNVITRFDVRWKRIFLVPVYLSGGKDSDSETDLGKLDALFNHRLQYKHIILFGIVIEEYVRNRGWSGKS